LQAFVNDGTLRASAGTLQVWSQAFDNRAAVQVAGGTVSIGQAARTWTNTGTITLDSGTLRLGGALTADLLAGSRYSRSGGSVAVDGTYTNTGQTLDIGSAGVFGTGGLTTLAGAIVGGTLLSSDAQPLLNLSGGYSALDGVTLEAASGQTAPLQVTGSLTIANDLRLGHGLTVGKGNHTWYLSNHSSLLGSAPNASATLVSTGGSINFGYGPSNAGPYASSIGAGITLRGSGTLGQYWPTTLTLAGTVDADVANQTVSISSGLQAFVNDGTLRASAGTLQLSPGTSPFSNTGVIELAGTGVLSTNNRDLTNAATGIVRGSGRIDLGSATRTLTNLGRILPGDGSTTGTGRLTLTGSLAGTGKTVFDLVGLARGASLGGYDTLQISGTAQLQGEHEIVVSGSYAPSLADTFVLVSAAQGVSGTPSITGSVTATASTPDPTRHVLQIGTSAAPVRFWDTDSSGLWSTAANWSGGVLPTAGDVVLIDRDTARPTVTVASGDQAALGIQSSGHLAVSGGSLSVQNRVQMAAGSGLTVSGGSLTATQGLDADGLSLSGGSLTLSSTAIGQVRSSGVISDGSLQGASVFTFLGPLDWRGGTIAGSGGETRVQGTLTVSNAGTAPVVLSGRNLTHTNNTGTSSVASGVTLNLDDAATFRNAAGAVLTVAAESGAQTQFLQRNGSGAAFFNEGTVNQTGTGTLGFTALTLQDGSFLQGQGGLRVDEHFSRHAKAGLGDAFSSVDITQARGSLSTGALYVNGPLRLRTLGQSTGAADIHIESGVGSWGDMTVESAGGLHIRSIDGFAGLMAGRYGQQENLLAHQTVLAQTIVLQAGNAGPSQNVALSSRGHQDIVARHGIELRAGTAGGGYGTGNSADIWANGEQRLQAGAGGILLQAGGGSGLDTDNAALITQNGTVSGTGQTLQLRDGGSLVLRGGSSTFDGDGAGLGVGHGSRAGVLAFGESQTIEFTGGGLLSLNGGSAGARAYASVYGEVRTQTIRGAVVDGSSGVAPTISLLGGSGGGLPGEGNYASITMVAEGSDTQQRIDATSLTLVGGSAGSDNYALVSSGLRADLQPNPQAIHVTGGLSLIGGSGSRPYAAIVGERQSLSVGDHMTMAGGTDGWARIGAPADAGSRAHELSLRVGGDLTLGGGGSSQATALIGSPSGATHRSDLDVEVTGSITLGAQVAGARIGYGSGTAAPAPGTVSVRAGVALTIEGGTVIRGAEAVNLSAASVQLGHGGAQGGVQGATVSIDASSGLQIRQGGVIAATATAGDSLVLDAGAGPFVNQAGAAALSTAGDARWLVYSADPRDDAIDGLSAAFKQYGASAPGQTTVLGTGNGLLYRLAPQVEVRLTGGAAGKVEKVYDGTDEAPLVGSSFEVLGAMPGDQVVVTSLLGRYTGGTAIENRRVGNGKTVEVEPLSLSASSNSIPVYGYAPASSVVRADIGVISRRDLAVGGITAEDKVYDGSTAATL
ncbi:MAG: beta strand repeat-containing protein, partial [Rubrivivax sp.]